MFPQVTHGLSNRFCEVEVRVYEWIDDPAEFYLIENFVSMAGDILVVYATGLGAVNGTTPANGENTGGATISNQVTPQVLIGGMSAKVLFSGLSPQFVGVNQLNIVVPDAAPGSSVPMQILVGGITSPATTTIAVTQ